VDEGLCSLRLTRRFRAAPAEVWAALTEPESVRRWLGDVEPRVRAEQPGRLLELDWDDRSLVRIELRPTEAGTVLVLEHSRLAEPRGMAAMHGWTVALERLGSVLG
jgi:uncharacterized protein YndB with AHSA1/START domain